MGETSVSKAIYDMIKKEFPQIRLTRCQCGIIRASHGARIHCAAPGWPDYVGYLPDGRFLGIEVKAPGSRTHKERTEIQTARQDDINSVGGVAFKTTGVEDCRQKLEKELLPFG